MSKSIFEKIANREIPGYVVWEDEEFIAFLDINPLAYGHTLMVPKTNIGDYIFELDDDRYTKLLLATKKVAKILKEKLQAKRVLIWVEGYAVPHVHVHLIPSLAAEEMLGKKRINISQEELKQIREKIVS